MNIKKGDILYCNVDLITNGRSFLKGAEYIVLNTFYSSDTLFFEIDDDNGLVAMFPINDNIWVYFSTLNQMRKKKLDEIQNR